jgi:hypothetical protein
MAKKNRIRTEPMIDCACVIHSTGYDWRYVENLYSMLTRALPGGIRFHVYTEHDRSVPPHMIKHILTEWPGIAGPKKSWWYKMQMFNPEHYSGNLLYLDLDTVVVRDLSWVSALDTRYFWAIRDFRYLQNPHHNGFNSSVMWWNVKNFSWIWEQFSQSDITQLIKTNPGDQDYITKVIDINQRRFFDDRLFESFRWQCLDGGYNFQRRQHKSPGSGVTIAPDTAVVIFHGSPKPHQILDTAITQLWR